MEELLQRTLSSTISVHVNKGIDLWPVKADPCQLENAILNLAINARDAMPNGGDLVVETSNTHLDHIYPGDNQGGDRPYVVISVSDTGTGMPKKVIGRAFEPFFSTNRRAKALDLD
jgi:signal transduction histidine kinase